jgi:hypothetical protein
MKTICNICGSQYDPELSTCSRSPLFSSVQSPPKIYPCPHLPDFPERNFETNSNPKDAIGVNKSPLNLVPPALLIYAAEGMRDGAKKYSPFNWRDSKVRASIYLAASLRHLLAYLDGEECAQDSGVHHLAHAVAGLGILIDAKENDCLIDDRPPKGPAPKLLNQFTKKL